MLNKQTPSATNYAVQSMKWHFTMALWCFIPTFLPSKALLHIYFYTKHTPFCIFCIFHWGKVQVKTAIRKEPFFCLKKTHKAAKQNEQS